MQLEALRSEIISLFQAFLPEDLASHWGSLVSKGPGRWDRIDPWKVWRHYDSSCMDEWRGTVDRKTGEIIWDERIAAFRTNSAVVLACGHSKPPVLHRVDLASTIGVSSPNWFLEGFVSILPGKLGLVENHDGEILVFQRRRT